jgi:DNA-directed RNA polymerase specialized sigma24 family protein
LRPSLLLRGVKRTHPHGGSADVEARSSQGTDTRTDARLLADAQHDPEAFRVLYDRYAVRVYSFFERRTRDHHASLDLTAETFARVWLSGRKFRDQAGGTAGPWLFTIARRILLASVEKRRLESEARMRLGLLREREDEQHEPDPVWANASTKLSTLFRRVSATPCSSASSTS